MPPTTTPAAKKSNLRRPTLSVAASSTANLGGDDEMVPASAELPKPHHDKVTKAARDEGRSFAGQIRFIVKAWAKTQPDA